MAVIDDLRSYLANLQAREVDALHRNADTDQSRRALHHTLGPRGNQASPGNHTHDGNDSPQLDLSSFTGTLDAAQVPNLDAGKITSGVFNPARIPDPDDTGWISITSGWASGFVTGTTGGPLQYRIRDGVCYWRGGVDGTMPTATYTTVVTGLPVETRHSFVMPIRSGAGFSGAVPGFAEMHSSGMLKFAQASGANKVWAAFNMSYPVP